MAPVVTNVPPPVIPGKSKKPIPPGIQTNGAGPSTSSPSPSLPSAQRPKNVAKPPTPITAPGANSTVGRVPNRARSGQPPGRASRNSIGLRSASLAADPAAAPTHAPRPYIVDKNDILKKFAGSPPSLIVHLHQNHLRFDNQDGTFPYGSTVGKMFMGHVKARTVPHEMLFDLTEAKVQFYEGCLIVQLHDHKSAAQKQDVARPVSPSAKVVSSSIHNYTPYVTPSPYVPFPKDNTARGPSTEPPKEKTSEEIDKENMPAPVGPPEASKSKVPPKAKVHTIVLHPTPQSLDMDLQIMAMTPRDSIETHNPPPTPMTAVPPTPTAAAARPAKRAKTDRMLVDSTNIREVEARILLATVPKLDLEPAKSHYDVIRILREHEHPDHASTPPKPKTRKRTVAEMAADEHQAAEQERYMLTLDDRVPANMAGGQGGGAGGDEGAIQGGAAVFEPRFERFKVINEIRNQHAEKKEQEKQNQAEKARKLEAEKQKQQLLAQQQAAQQAKADQDAAREKQRQQAQQASREATLQARRAAEQRAAQQSQQAQAQAAQNQAAQAQAQAQAQQNQNAANMVQASHAHPAQSPAMVNGMPNGIPAGINVQQARLAQVSQPAVASPIVRQNTPQNMSSPMVGSVPMQASGSNMGSNMGSVMGGSPARPSSVVQNHPMAVNMSAQGSQRSHPAGTPRQPHATPNMQNVGTPVSRPQVMQTPRMPQASPNMSNMTPQAIQQMHMMNQGSIPMGMNAQQLAAAQQAQMQARQRQLHAQAQHLAMANGGMMNNPQAQQQAMQMAQQQRAMLMQQQIMQQQQAQMRGQQGSPQGMHAMQMQAQQMAMNGVANPQIQAMQQQQQAHLQRQLMAQAQQNGGQPMNLNAGNGQITPAQMAMLQQMQNQQRMQAQQQQQAGMQQNPQMQQQVQQLATANFSRIYQASLQEMVSRYGSREAIPQQEHQNAMTNCQQQAMRMAQATLAKRSQLLQMQQAQQAAMMQQQMGTPGMGQP